MEKKKVWLSITGKTAMESESDDIIELITEGEFYRQDKSAYLSYDESEVSGLEGTKTTIELEKEKLSIIRLGSMNSHMIFEKGKRNLNTYATPYGAMTMSVYTQDIDVDYDQNDQPTKIFVDYNIEISGQGVSKNTLNIDVKH